MSEVLNTLTDMGLTIRAEFVPFSRSRNKVEKHPSLNWLVTVVCRGRDVLTTDYMAGMGHCPAYKAAAPRHRNLVTTDTAIRAECETGRESFLSGPLAGASKGKCPILPKAEDVFYSLVSDSSVLDSAGFEDWASEFGMDTDSRSAEATYRACLKIALKLRAAVGDSGLGLLRDVFADY